MQSRGPAGPLCRDLQIPVKALRPNPDIGFIPGLGATDPLHSPEALVATASGGKGRGRVANDRDGGHGPSQRTRATRGSARADLRVGRRHAGFTIIELALAMAVLVVGVLGFSQSIMSARLSIQRTHELDRAAQATREMLERIEAEAFADAFRRFNADPSDDPGGAGTAPGASFAVNGLSALPSDVDHMPGEVIFPIRPGFSSQLREDAVLPELGMPRDLNGDGVVDGNDHALDYRLLPVIVRVNWRSAAGPASYELKTLLANY
jgi:type II secretory pathway pseudopilin PulG